MKKAVSEVMLTLLLIGTLASVFNIQPVKTEPKPWAVDDEYIARSWDKESKVVRVIERKITTFDLQKLKQRVGICKENKDHNPIIKGHGTGLCPPTEEEWAKILDKTYIVERILLNETIQSLSNVDQTTTPWFPPIGNQDGEGSCVAWAVGYYMKTFQEAKEHGWNLSGAEWEGGYFGYPTPLYQDRIFSPDFIYHLINGGVDQGSFFYDAISLVCAVGASSWEKMSYDPNNSTSWPSEEAWKEAPLYRGNSSGYEYLVFSTNNDLISLKNWIASDHLAIIGVDGYQYSNLTSEDVWTLDNYVSPNTNHANTIVGYDDNIEYTEEGELRYGAFKIANSWGKGGWENTVDGCYWISYEAMKQRVGYCMFYRDRIDYQPELVASFRIDHPKRGECNILIGLGNHSSPIATKSFNDLIDGGNHPFCTNNILFDITEFKDVAPTVYNQSFFMKVYDGGSVTTGTVTDFSIKYAVSEDPPITTVNGNSVYADVVLPDTIRVPSNYATIQEAINSLVLGLNDDPGVTIQVASRIYYEHVVVNKTVSLVGENRSTVIVDGNGTTAITLVANNISMAHLTIRNGEYGVFVNDSSNYNIIKNCVVSQNWAGIFLNRSSGNRIGNCLILNNGWPGGRAGIVLYRSNANYVVNSEVVNNRVGIDVDFVSSFNSISNCTVSDNNWGIILRIGAYKNQIIGTNIVSNYNVGLSLEYSDDYNKIYHNNFINNTEQLSIEGSSDTSWDDGYPSGGNYWSDYGDVDNYRGPFQNKAGSDGIGDTEHIIDANNTDNYPLTKPYGGPCDIGITNITTSKTVVGQGYDLNVTTTILNYGVDAETFNVTAFANTTIIQTKTITLTSRNSTSITFIWDSAGSAYGSYIINVTATPILGETDTGDNNFTYGIIKLTIPGDFSGDFHVDPGDFALLAVAFGSTPWEPDMISEWNPNCDVDGNNKVDPFDYAMLCVHYGEHHP